MGGLTIKRVSGWISTAIAIALVMGIGQHIVRAQDRLASTSQMPHSLVAALSNLSSSQRVLLPDGRALILVGSQLQIELRGEHGYGLAKAQQVALPEVRRFATLTVMPDGRVLIWGGIDTHGRVFKNGLWFDPSTSVLTDAIGVPLLPRAGHTATVLTDGRLLVTGGWSPGLGSMPEAELWDPRTGRVQVATSLLEPPRVGQTAMLLADGQVEISGGIDPAGKPVIATSIFDPVTEQFAVTSAAGLMTPIDGMSAPTLAASSPAPNTTSFPAGGLIALRFSELMDPRSLNAKAITLLGPGGNTPIKVVGAESGRLAFITPASDLYPGAHYTLFLQNVMSQRNRGLPFAAIDFSVAVENALSPNLGSTTSSSKSAAPSITFSDRARTASTNTSAVTSSVTQAALHLMTGTDSQPAAVLSSCGVKGRSIRALCRAKSYMVQGAWYPGQDAAGDATAGHWRLNKPDMSPQEIAYAALMLRVPGGNGPTGISGRVELIDGTPIANVDVSIGTIHVRTNAQGRFTLTGAPAGRQTLFVDGTAANTPGHEYGQFVVGVNLKAGVVLPLSYRMYLPRILDRDKVNIASPTQRDLVITHPDMPGLEIHIPAGTVIKDYKGKIVTQLAIVPTPVDRAPFPTPGNFPVFFSIEPAGATIQNLDPHAHQGIQIVYPNYQHVAPGTATNFFAYDARDGWKMYGPDRVTQDGSQIVPDAGVYVHQVMPLGGLQPPQNNHPGDGQQGKLCGACTGDPVDLWSDTLEQSTTDIRIDDIVPITLQRSFHATSLTNETRAFGGWRSNYDIYVYSPDQTFNTLSVRLPDGNLLPFTKVATLPGDYDTWTYAGSPSKWYGAVLEGLDFNARCMNDAECYLLTLKDGTQYQFYGEGSNQALNYIRDRFGNQITLTYSAGLLQQITSPSGHYINLTYNSDNYIATAADNTGRTWTYNYTKHVQPSPALTWFSLDSVTYPDATSWQYTYQTDWASASLGTLSTIVDRDGHQALSNTYTQVAGGQTGSYTTYYVASQTLADGTSYSFARTPFGTGTQEMDVTDPNGHVRKVVMDPDSGYPTAETYAAGTPQAKTMTYVRDSSGVVDSQTDALGRTTSYTYDAVGNILSTTRLAGTSNAVTEQFAWTPDHQIASYTDALGHTSTFAYTNGCLTSIKDPLNHITSVVCSASGQPLSIKDALGHVTKFAYQAYDLRSVTDPLNRTTTYTTDALGRVIAVADSLGNLERRVYNSDGRISTLLDPTNQTTGLTYDGNGNVTSVTLPSAGTIQYTYDVRNRLIKRTDALAQPESWTYDGMGDVLSHTDRKNQLTTYQYDALNRRILTTFADGSTITPGYDAGDRVTSLMDSANGNQTFSWDGLDRLMSAANPQGTVTYGYDKAGRRTSMTAGSQAKVAYTYDNADRVTKLTQGSETVSLAYDNANRRSTLTLPNGVKVTYSYDNANELTGISYKQGNGTTLGNLAYAYDSAGRRISQTGTLASDTLPTATTQTSTFDLNNRQTGFNSASLTYDADGNLSSDGTNQYVWNARNQLVQVKQGALTLASYGYDALGRRQSKSVNGATATTFLYDGLNPVQETQGSTITPILTGLGVDEFFARTEPTGRDYFLTDAQGSTIGLTDASGNLAQRYQYSPYGEVTAQNAGFTNPYQYTGRENDGDGLYYYRARYYSPNTKNFISEDPLKLAAGINSYSYVHDDSLERRDPFGEDDSVCMYDPGACSGGLPPAPFGDFRAGLSISWQSDGIGDPRDTSSWTKWFDDGSVTGGGKNWLPDYGVSITFCTKRLPDSPDCNGNDPHKKKKPPLYDNWSIGFKDLGLQVDRDGTICVNIGPGFGSPYNLGDDTR